MQSEGWRTKSLGVSAHGPNLWRAPSLWNSSNITFHLKSALWFLHTGYIHYQIFQQPHDANRTGIIPNEGNSSQGVSTGSGLSLLTPTCCPLKGLLGKMAAFSCGVKTSSRTMWGIIVLIFSFTYLLYFMFSSSSLSPGTWDLTRVFEVLVTGTLEGLGPGTVILVPLLPLNASPLRTYPKKCCRHLASFSASLLLLGSHYRQYLAPTSGLIGKWDFCHPGFLVLDNSSPSH